MRICSSQSIDPGEIVDEKVAFICSVTLIFATIQVRHVREFYEKLKK